MKLIMAYLTDVGGCYRSNCDICKKEIAPEDLKPIVPKWHGKCIKHIKKSLYGLKEEISKIIGDNEDAPLFKKHALEDAIKAVDSECSKIGCTIISYYESNEIGLTYLFNTVGNEAMQITLKFLRA